MSLRIGKLGRSLSVNKIKPGQSFSVRTCVASELSVLVSPLMDAGFSSYSGEYHKVDIGVEHGEGGFDVRSKKDKSP